MCPPRDFNFHSKGKVDLLFENNERSCIRLELNRTRFTWSEPKSLELKMGLPGFEPESIEPKSTSLDQASRQPLHLLEHNFCCIIKTLARPLTL